MGSLTGKVIKTETIGLTSPKGTYVRWTVERKDGSTRKVWTEKSGTNYDDMKKAYDSRNDTHPLKPEIKYTKKVVTRVSGKKVRVKWVDSVSI